MPDIRQLSTCCGKPLVWRDYVTFDGRYSADCSGCGADLCVEAMEQARELTATEDLLLARIAELEAANAEILATLANERGEGEAPVEGWAWGQGGEIPDPCWHKGEAVAYMEKAFDPEPATPAHYWLWWVPGMPCCQRANTARDAMRAASGAP
jgi:hypothetical protein